MAPRRPLDTEDSAKVPEARPQSLDIRTSATHSRHLWANAVSAERARLGQVEAELRALEVQHDRLVREFLILSHYVYHGRLADPRLAQTD
jgi:hypothetical protein